jgi:sec-independent protein translocase protein TatC
MEQPPSLPVPGQPRLPSQAPPEPEPREMTFIEHLEELRWHLVRVVVVTGLLSIAAFVAKRFVFDVLIFGPKSQDFLSYRALCALSHQFGLGEKLCIVPPEFTIANFRMMGEFMAHLQVSLVAGLILGFPYLLWEFWRFVRPGLHEGEIHSTRGLVAWCTLLFVLGISFGYFIIVPFSINFLIPYSISDQVGDYIQLGDYISFVSTITLAAGILFELPVVMYFLAKVGLVSADFLRRYRRHALVVILVLSAIITPPDAFSQMLIALPVMLLYEVGIGIAARLERAEKRANPG